MSNVSHRYRGASRATLSHVHLHVDAGEAVAVVGPSGSGKSTLLALAGLLTPASGGVLTLNGHAVTTPSQAMLTRLRRENVGVLFQESHLIRHLTVLENVMTPVLARSVVARDTYARELLTFVGLGDYGARMPGTLSGGQAQRVALCRALVNRPKLIVADEPTASLDGESAALIRELLGELRGQGQSFLLATHDSSTADWADRQYRIRDGSVSESVDDGAAR